MAGGVSMRMTLKYVAEDTDRHGNVRLYYRRNGRKVRLRGPVGSPEFLTDYRRAAARPKESRKKSPPKPGVLRKDSLHWLCAQYYKSTTFAELGAGTQKTRRSILERFCQRKGNGSIDLYDADAPHTC